jgi:hypothetical protein
MPRLLSKSLPDLVWKESYIERSSHLKWTSYCKSRSMKVLAERNAIGSETDLPPCSWEMLHLCQFKAFFLFLYG